MAISWVVLFLAGLGVVFLYGWSVTGPHLQYIAVGLLAAAAAMGGGALLGFLFGVPRYVSSGQARLEEKEATGGQRFSLTPSTNLAEISDWLTKLLLGVGLVQLTHLGGPARSLVRSLAEGLESPARSGSVSGASVAAAGAILVLFSVLGFIMGYVLTTLWYGGALQRMFDAARSPAGTPSTPGTPTPGTPAPGTPTPGTPTPSASKES